MKDRIGLLGCGWLGFPLARAFVALGYKVHGSTTSNDKLQLLSKAGVEPFLIKLTEEQIHGDISAFMKDIDVLIVNVPPGLRNPKSGSYVRKMELLADCVRKQSEIKAVLFVSSTSVYGELSGEVTESSIPSPVTESGKQLLLAEQLFGTNPELQTTILRFAGLIGPDRHPVLQLSGKRELKNGDHPVNLIHLDDCIEIIIQIVTEGLWDEIFNGVFPEHPTKREYYTLEAKKRGIKPPEYRKENGGNQGKIVKSKIFPHKIYGFKTSIFN